jgi:uncharacterized SAM-dependent methyltransferase
MTKKREGPSQLVDLFFSVAGDLGATSDREIAALAGVSIENVAHWRSGGSQEFKPQKLMGIKQALRARIHALRQRAGAGVRLAALAAIEIEESGSPAELQRQFRDRVHYDYLGHRFLYYDPQGALAWESLIRTGYEQDAWLRGADECARAWLDPARSAAGQCRGALAQALGFDRKGKVRGLDVVGLGPGEGAKERLLLERVLDLEEREEQRLPWIAMALVDVSIPLLLRAATDAWATVQTRAAPHAVVLPFAADFEEGPSAFLERLPTSERDGAGGVRLVAILGNVFGNLRDEEVFVRQRLWKMLRPGDLVWIEVGLRLDRIQDDPLYPLTEPGHEETAAETNRRLLLEGPYRRWEAALGRNPGDLSMKVRIREDDESARIPGSCNFSHDLAIERERRVTTMLYSRRYQLEGLTRWLEELGLAVERISRIEDSKKRPRVAHILARRR